MAPRPPKSFNNIIAFCLHNVGICNFNPVKHGLVKRVCDYEFSSFHRDVKRGFFAPYWGSLIDDEIINLYNE